MRHALRHRGRAAADRDRGSAGAHAVLRRLGGQRAVPGAFPESVRVKARSYAEKFGDQLLKEGYRGYFDIDILIDQDDEVYLGELNPRICGASPITNHAAFAHADVPLFLFHLLEFSDADFDLDVGALNDRWSDPRYIDSWSAMVSSPRAPRSSACRSRRSRASTDSTSTVRWDTASSTTGVRPSRLSATGSSCASPAPATGGTRAPTWHPHHARTADVERR